MNLTALFAPQMFVLTANIGLNVEFCEGRKHVLVITVTPWCLGQHPAHGRIRLNTVQLFIRLDTKYVMSGCDTWALCSSN